MIIFIACVVAATILLCSFLVLTAHTMLLNADKDRRYMKELVRRCAEYTELQKADLGFSAEQLPKVAALLGEICSCECTCEVCSPCSKCQATSLQRAYMEHNQVFRARLAELTAEVEKLEVLKCSR